MLAYSTIQWIDLLTQVGLVLLPGGFNGQYLRLCGLQKKIPTGRSDITQISPGRQGHQPDFMLLLGLMDH